jgi:glutamate---cysteine ligase / carboxylate-amine ligase
MTWASIGDGTLMSLRKIGVEEELMLVDPATHRLTAVSERAVRANEEHTEVAHELFLQQIETSTPPVEKVDELLQGIVDGRRAVGQAAAAAGARAVAMPLPVLAENGPAITPKDRYRRIQEEYGELARQALVCGMHVHVDVREDEAVPVVDGIRPWLPMLLALSANSPYWQGRDTAHASWRSQVWKSWPAATTAQPYGDAETYRQVGRTMLAWGAGLDEGMLYFDVRLAASYPTVEIRIADVCTEVDDAALVAVLARALVSTAARASEVPTWRADLLHVATWRAARWGLSADLVHPLEHRLVPPRVLFEATVQHAREALEETGDLDFVTDAFERLVARGGGATRQRRVHESRGDLRAVVEDLADRTDESWS